MRASIRLLNGLLLASLALPACASENDHAEEHNSTRQQAIELLESTPLIDGHNDLPWQYRDRVDNRLEAVDITRDTREVEPRPLHTDIPRLRAGRVGGQFWSVYVPGDIRGADAVMAQLEQIDLTWRLIMRHDDLQLATTASEVEAAFNDGKIASLLGMEGGHVLNNSLATLRLYHQLGARYLTLTHNQANDWADSATEAPRHGGLSEFGREVVREMNRLGMLIDLSHTHPETMHDALDTSEAPVIFSHSSAHGLTPHPRNVPDEVLDRLPENGGVIMVTFVPSFVSEAVHQWWASKQAEQKRLETLHPGEPEQVEARLEAWEEDHPRPPATIADVADHIDYIRDRIGVEYIGIGGDYDGIRTLPEGLEDVSTYPALFAELIGRGYDAAELKAIAGGNILRVMREAEAVASRLHKARDPSDVRFDDF